VGPEEEGVRQMRRRTFIAVGLALTVSATALEANGPGFDTPSNVDHDIIMTGEGYFPVVTYVQNGDVVRFVNLSGQTIRTRTRTNSYYWNTGWLSNNQTYTMTVSNSTQLRFKNDSDYNVYYGEMSYSAVPTD
jgi:plastocyanin